MSDEKSEDRRQEFDFGLYPNTQHSAGLCARFCLPCRYNDLLTMLLSPGVICCLPSPKHHGADIGCASQHRRCSHGKRETEARAAPGLLHSRCQDSRISASCPLCFCRDPPSREKCASPSEPEESLGGGSEPVGGR